MKFHPYSEQYPPMSEAGLQVLAADMAEHGQIQPGLTFRGELADGRNRWRAWVEILGRPTEGYQSIEFDGTEADLISHLDALNLRRRHLSASQRACLAVLRMEIVREIRKACPKTDRLTREDAAQEFGVSTGYIANAMAVRNAYSELFRQVFLGERELSAAYAWVLDQKRGRRDVKPANDETKVTGTGKEQDQELAGEGESTADAGDSSGTAREELAGETGRPEKKEKPEREARGFSLSFRCCDEEPHVLLRVEVHARPGVVDVAFCPLCGDEVDGDRHEVIG